MISEENLWVLEYDDCAGCVSAHVQALDSTHATIFVIGRAVKSCREFLASPLLQLALLYERNPGIGSEGMPDVVAIAQSVRLEIELNCRAGTRISWGRART